jgi:hypothetical protein
MAAVKSGGIAVALTVGLWITVENGAEDFSGTGKARPR